MSISLDSIHNKTLLALVSPPWKRFPFQQVQPQAVDIAAMTHATTSKRLAAFWVSRSAKFNGLQFTYHSDVGSTLQAGNRCAMWSSMDGRAKATSSARAYLTNDFATEEKESVPHTNIEAKLDPIVLPRRLQAPDGLMLAAHYPSSASFMLSESLVRKLRGAIAASVAALAATFAQGAGVVGALVPACIHQTSK